MSIVWFSLALVAGWFFFCLRRQYRSPYGFIEIGVGMIILIVIFFLTQPYLTGDNPSEGYLLLNQTVGLFAGIYAIVRGLDNIASSE